MRTVTLQDIADSLGIARSTVSRALRDDPQISTEMRLRVQRLASDLGYRPNAAARALTRRRAGAVGLMLPRTSSFVFSNPYFSELLEGIATVAEPAGYPLLVSASPSPDYAGWLGEGRVDGIITLGSFLGRGDARLLEAFASRGAPVVLVHPAGVPCTLPTVRIDESAGLAQACVDLAAAGCRRVAVITGPQRSHYARRRGEGWQEAATAAGLEVTYLLHGDDTLRSGAEAARTLLRAAGALDAWVFGNDLMALGGLAERDAAGAEVAVVGFDDVAAAALVGLSTVHQPIRALGSEAMRLLAHAIEGGTAEPVVLPTHFVARRSSGRVPSRSSSVADGTTRGEVPPDSTARRVPTST